MFFNIIVGFILPWILGISLYFKKKKIFTIIYPFGCTVSYTFNMIGMELGFWQIKPYSKGMFAALPLNLGLYPIVGILSIVMINKKLWQPNLLIFIFSLVTTIFEFLILALDRAVYDHGWNLFWTFVSYLAAYSLGYGFYILLRNNKILA